VNGTEATAEPECANDEPPMSVAALGPAHVRIKTMIAEARIKSLNILASVLAVVGLVLTTLYVAVNAPAGTLGFSATVVRGAPAAQVTDVAPGGPADRAGIRVGDVVRARRSAVDMLLPANAHSSPMAIGFASMSSAGNVGWVHRRLDATRKPRCVYDRHYPLAVWYLYRDAGSRGNAARALRGLRSAHERCRGLCDFGDCRLLRKLLRRSRSGTVVLVAAVVATGFSLSVVPCYFAPAVWGRVDFLDRLIYVTLVTPACAVTAFFLADRRSMSSIKRHVSRRSSRLRSA